MRKAAGGCGEASRTRVREVWGQFKENGNLHRASETWAVRVEEEQRMERNENVRNAKMDVWSYFEG